jgi:hypothetical protein
MVAIVDVFETRSESNQFLVFGLTLEFLFIGEAHQELLGLFLQLEAQPFEKNIFHFHKTLDLHIEPVTKIR